MFSAVICIEVVHNDTCTHDQFLDCWSKFRLSFSL